MDGAVALGRQGVEHFVGNAVARQWTSELESWSVLAPVLGLLVSTVASPALRAARIEPARTLQR